jgi:hypothetical protein
MESGPFVSPFSTLGRHDTIKLSSQDTQVLKEKGTFKCSNGWQLSLGENLVITHRKSWESQPVSLLGFAASSWDAASQDEAAMRIGASISTLRPSFCAILKSEKGRLSIQGDYLVLEETRLVLERFAKKLMTLIARGG